MDNISFLIPKNRYHFASRNLQALDIYAEETVEIPMLGWVAAGLPVDICTQNDKVAVPANMVRTNSYALKVRGNSMIDDNIQDGDIIVIEKRETAENGQSVIAMINGEQVTLKKFYIERSGIRLQPANSELEPIYLKNEDVQILGIVTGVIRPIDG